MEMENLQKTIEKMKLIFKNFNLDFTGNEADFWAMLNDPDILEAIALVMDKKIKEANSKFFLQMLMFGFYI